MGLKPGAPSFRLLSLSCRRTFSGAVRIKDPLSCTLLLVLQVGMTKTTYHLALTWKDKPEQLL